LPDSGATRVRGTSRVAARRCRHSHRFGRAPARPELVFHGHWHHRYSDFLTSVDKEATEAAGERVWAETAVEGLGTDIQGDTRQAVPAVVYKVDARGLHGLHFGSMGSPVDHIFNGLTDELERKGITRDLLEAVGENELYEYGRSAAQLVAAPFFWSHAIGERWDVHQVTEFLDVSRQAVYKRVRTGSLLGLRGAGTTWFPVWQFDPERRVVRHLVASIIEAFCKADPDVDPLVIATWATSKNTSLEGRTPAEVVVAGGADERVGLAAIRAARGLAA